jgi:hypothetical protein
MDAQSKGMDLFYENQKNQMDQQTAQFQQQLDLQKIAMGEKQLELMDKRNQLQQERVASSGG